ncbi:hypothetical protein B0H16DRAFT_1728459 [Mycena metata]|uniref:F-box domain-containing protein n=1 Tax=Mycena metata TaxID=1033252 RepID=A0AAD7IGD0_9AGAR|nr:hypothetical protein B0H16DRAFT_1728459 [Mycena metata]
MSASVSLLDLPLELLALVLAEVCDRTSLETLSLTCRAISDLSRPILFRRVTIHRSSASVTDGLSIKQVWQRLTRTTPGMRTLGNSVRALTSEIPSLDAPEEHGMLAQIIDDRRTRPKVGARQPSPRTVFDLLSRCSLTALKLHEVWGVSNQELSRFESGCRTLILVGVRPENSAAGVGIPAPTAIMHLSLPFHADAWDPIMKNPRLRKFFMGNLQSFVWGHFPGQSLAVLGSAVHTLDRMASHLRPARGHGYADLISFPSVRTFCIVVNFDYDWMNHFISPSLLGIIRQIPACMPALEDLQVRLYTDDPPLDVFPAPAAMSAWGIDGILDEIGELMSDRAALPALRHVRWFLRPANLPRDSLPRYCNYFIPRFRQLAQETPPRVRVGYLKFNP